MRHKWKINGKQCPKNMQCYTEYYTFRQICLAYGAKLHTILLDIPQYPVLSIKHTPRIEALEFVSYVASIISLWFGFSVIMLSKPLQEMPTYFQIVYNKCKYVYSNCFANSISNITMKTRNTFKKWQIKRKIEVNINSRRSMRPIMFQFQLTSI